MNPKNMRRGLLALTALIALGACGTDDQPSAERIMDPALPNETTSITAEDEFRLWAGDNVDDMKRMRGHMDAGTEAIVEFDIPGAVREFRAAADEAESIHPPQGTFAAELTQDALDTCADAFNESADAMESFDTDAIDRSIPHLDDCADAFIAAAEELDTLL